ncbi:hypothetical protein N7481_007687 [Penicillium waksmanii]|uniref:uncharacterized protein n=1 Tax=Penicillium waksmanii TaxID=69791 RepID=UPI00254850F9|nr:uncharacterized protein N7481_007687 [Penicillium waksmanii]KAJ5980389.1 hypothetical protein N7481_007687 [Penicillium waksmanii]
MTTPFDKVLWPSTFNFLVGPYNAVPICSAFTPRRTSTGASTRALGIYVPPVLFSAADTHATTSSESNMATVRSSSCLFGYVQGFASDRRDLHLISDSVPLPELLDHQLLLMNNSEFG